MNTYDVVKYGDMHYIIDARFLKAIEDSELFYLIPRFAISSAKRVQTFGEYALVGKAITDGKDVIFTTNFSPSEIERVVESVKRSIPECVKVTYPHLLFHDGSLVSTFVRLGKLTLYANFTRYTAKLYIPHGEISAKKEKIKDLLPNSFIDLVGKSYNVGAYINSYPYRNENFTEASDAYGHMGFSLIPYSDIVFLLRKYLYVYDGGQVRVEHPFKMFDIDPILIDSLSPCDVVRMIDLV